MSEVHLFQDPSFWQHYQQQVETLRWKGGFTGDDLIRTLDTDAKLYTDGSVLRHRRTAVVPWLVNDSQWAALVLGATAELARRRPGPHSQTLRGLRVLDALRDLVEHLDCFYTVSSAMREVGQEVESLSVVHDIDKLHPVMLVGYSERFEDGADTTLWGECVGRHVCINPHHQGHRVWRGEGADDQNMRKMALREMVCDKVSRRLQKNLGGVVSGDMWNVEGVYFEGLPSAWMDRASKIMKRAARPFATAN